MKERDLVSVIMCFLNGSAWISEAIESVLQQNHTLWELILVDDGSSDGSSDIARRYAFTYPSHIIYLNHPGHVNRGLTISRNSGIALARGEFIAFLDADDCWFPGKLAADLRLFILNPLAAMICQASTFWYSWEDPDRTDLYVAVGADPDNLYPPLSLTTLLYPLGTGAPPCPSGIIVRTDAVKRNGGFEEEFSGIYGLYEDQAFLAKMYINEYVFVSGRANNLYRKHAGSMTDRLSDERLYAQVRLFFLDWLANYLALRHFTPAALVERVDAIRTQLRQREAAFIRE